MENSEIQYATEKLTQLKSEYQVDVIADWGQDSDGAWKKGNWSKDELERLHRSIGLLAGIMGRGDKFIQNLGGVKLEKADMGSHGGEAQAHDGALGARLLGRILEIEPPGLREVDQDATRLAEVEDHVLRPAVDPLDRTADERLRCRHHRLQRREAQRLHAFEHLAGEGVAEALGQRLHLRQLGHDSAVLRLAPRPRRGYLHRNGSGG